MKEGQTAKISGYVYGNNLSVTTMEIDNRFISFRDKNGQPVWGGSRFSRGNGREVLIQ